MRSSRPLSKLALYAVPGLVAWVTGTAIAYVLASLAHTQTILAALAPLGVRIDARTRLVTTLGDLAGLWRYGAVIAVALGLGLAVVRLVRRRPWGAGGGLPAGAVAGALAVGVALVAMRAAFSFTPIASARDAPGLVGQCLAGAAGGLAFVVCVRAFAWRHRSG